MDPACGSTGTQVLALEWASDIVGYRPYLDRIPERPGQTRHGSDNRVEIDRARETGEFLNAELAALAVKYPHVISRVRGLGLMIGIELADKIPAFSTSEKAPAIQFVNRLHEAGLLAIPAGTRIIRVLPALNLPREDAAEGLRIFETVAAKLSP